MEPGIYRGVQCGPAAVGKSLTKGTPQITVPFEIEDNGKRILWIGYLTGDSAEFTIKTLKVLKFTGKSIKEVNGFISKEPVSLTIDYDEYEGKKRLRIQWVNDVNPSNPLESDELSKLCKQFDKLL